MAATLASSCGLSFARKESSFAGESVSQELSNVKNMNMRNSVKIKRIECKESRIGRRPIPIPNNVKIELDGCSLQVKGPLGELSRVYPREVELIHRQDSSTILVNRAIESRRARQMHGLFRTLTDNMVIGVSKGFEKKLIMVGVGYRASVVNKEITMNVGFSHPVKINVPDGLTVKVEDNVKISVSGRDKCEVGQFAATIRSWRKPEPYKGKGIKYEDEIIRRKEGKAGKKK